MVKKIAIIKASGSQLPGTQNNCVSDEKLTPRGVAFWLVVAAVGTVNAAFHIVATARTHAYSPGVVTGVALYLPLGLIGGAWLVRDHLVAPGTVAQAVFIAAAYQAWSAWTHRRHALVLPAS